MSNEEDDAIYDAENSDSIDGYSDDGARYSNDDVASHGYEPMGTPRTGMSKGLVTVISILAAIGIVAAATLVWLAREIRPSGPVGDPIGTLIIPDGSTLGGVADILEKEEIIGSARAFTWYSKFADVNPPLAGEYVNFEKNLPLADVVDVLNDGPIAPGSIVLQIIPGVWLSDALEKIAETFPAIEMEDLLRVIAEGEIRPKYLPENATSWEGFILPETHEFESTATAEEVLARLVATTDSTMDELGYGNAVASTGLNAYDLVTIASMIERETGDVEGERGKIAQVVFNRLDRDIALGIDAAILYGLQRRGGTDDPLTKSDLETDTPYNNRINKGLPPTPIALPSEQSLEAAINPTDGPWIYYVLISDSPREHLFTESAAEFERAKAESREKGLA